MFLAEPALQVRARIDARGGMALVVDLVADAGGEVLTAEEVVVAHLIQRRGARVRRDVAADSDRLVRTRHHDRCVPADVGADTPFDVLVTREPRLALGRDGVDVVGAAQSGHADLAFAGAFEQLQQQEPSPLPPVRVDSGIEGLDPLARLFRVDVG